MYAIRNGKFFGIRVRGNRYLTEEEEEFMEEIMYGLESQIESRLDEEDTTRQIQNRTLVRTNERTRLYYDILDTIIRTGTIRESGLSAAYGAWKQQEEGYFEDDANFQSYFGHLWNDTNTAVKDHLSRYYQMDARRTSA